MKEGAKAADTTEPGPALTVPLEQERVPHSAGARVSGPTFAAGTCGVVGSSAVWGCRWQHEGGALREVRWAQAQDWPWRAERGAPWTEGASAGVGWAFREGEGDWSPGSRVAGQWARALVRAGLGPKEQCRGSSDLTGGDARS